MNIYKFLSRRNYSFCRTSPILSSVEFQQRRLALVEEIRSSIGKNASSSSSSHLCFIPSAQVKYQAFHIPYEFRQDTTFLYFTGFPATKSLLALFFNQHDDEVKSTLFIEERNSHQIQWDGPVLSANEAQSITGIDDIRGENQIENYLKNYLSQKKAPLLWMPDPNVTANDNYHQLIQQAFLNHGETQVYNLSHLVDRLRVIKSDLEIQCHEQAARIIYQSLWQTLCETRDGFQQNLSENEISAKLNYLVKSIGNVPLGYPPVIAGGSRANIIHYLHNNQMIQPGELVLVDAGANFHGYLSDVTRTWPVAGNFSLFQRVLYEIVLESQEVCKKFCSPEKSLDDVHMIMIKTLTHLLKKERILSPDATTADTISLCPHHVGHYLGLDIHDAPSISTHERLEKNMVFTLEPGLYVPMNSSIVARDFHGIGIRIEDDFYLDASGKAVLLGSQCMCPKTIVEIEQGQCDGTKSASVPV